MAPLRFLAGLVLALALAPARADLPTHCLPEDVLGEWTFVSDDAPHQGMQLCGHSTPNGVQSMLKLNAVAQERLVTDKEQFKVTLTNHVDSSTGKPLLVALGPDGPGSWTMVFDEGFEVRLNGRTYFAQFDFELLPGKKGTDGDMLDKIGQFYGRVDGHVLRAFPDPVYACHCERTSVGWHSRPATANATASTGLRQFGCFRAHREGPTKVGLVQAHSPSALVSLPKGARAKKAVLARQEASMSWGHGTADSAAIFATELGGSRLRGTWHGWHGAEQKPLPASFDWRNQEELKQPGDDLATEFDQGGCGSCYAFSGVLALSMRFRIALARKLGRPTALDLSWRGAVRCSPYTEGCNGGFPFLVGRHAQEVGLFQQTTTLKTSAQCMIDSDPDNIASPCTSTCLSPDPTRQPVYYAKDYGYVGGFAQGASEEEIMREILERGPISIELSVKAIPMLFSGNRGQTITTYDNNQPHQDDVPAHAADHRLAHLTAEHNQTLSAHRSKPFEFKNWLWVDHALLSVGWGEESAPLAHQEPSIVIGTPLQLVQLQKRQPDHLKYWVIRNSWGQDWAEGGYGKLVRGENAGGIEISAVWITPDLERLPKEIPGPATH